MASGRRAKGSGGGMVALRRARGRLGEREAEWRRERDELGERERSARRKRGFHK